MHYPFHILETERRADEFYRVSPFVIDCLALHRKENGDITGIEINSPSVAKTPPLPWPEKIFIDKYISNLSCVYMAHIGRLF